MGFSWFSLENWSFLAWGFDKEGMKVQEDIK